MKKWNIYLINLARSKDRLHTCAQQFERYDLPFERVDAVDGNNLLSTEVDTLYNFNRSSYHKEMTRGEIGCYLSHVRVWQKIVDEQLDYALVLEDDIILKENIVRGLEAIQHVQQPWDLIKLAEAPIKRKVLHQYSVNEFSLVTYNKVPSRTCAQFISFEGAKKLLALRSNIMRPIDIELQYWWQTKLNIFGMKPYIVEANQAVESEIDASQTRHKAKQSLGKKIANTLYFLIKNKQELKKRLDKLG